ncbi:MAG TPA: hypothetical protein VKD91_09190 [Pyrinomonadaceae bacterium]|nr:hypothetical protein [Pyrinomonadaceae bacterium]
MPDLLKSRSVCNELRPGDLVEVRSWPEIAATLDRNGTFEKLPFMPEMLSYCGRQFRVSRQAFKTCVDDQEMRQLGGTVLLEEVRCNGKSHGGCGKACLIFWKEAWLKRAGAPAAAPGLAEPNFTLGDLKQLALQDGRFFCQSSEIVKASTPLPWWEPKQYLWDLSRNRMPWAQWLKSVTIAIYNKVAHLGRFHGWGHIAGPGQQNGHQPLGLQTGDLVRVKPLAQIRQTLDAEGKHKQLLFAPAMAEFCGQVLRVRNRVDKIVLEGTQKQRELKDTVVLEGATCDGICHRMCPRQSLLFWRECWLERVVAN